MKMLLQYNVLDLGKRCFGHAIICLVGYSLIYMNLYDIFNFIFYFYCLMNESCISISLSVIL
jgi:hypothetical protein